jgi:Putative zinc-finger
MDHLRFKSDQTAAAYVADELDPEHREEFELHMMSCLDCVEDVEGWRALKNHLPQPAAPQHAPAGLAPAPEHPLPPQIREASGSAARARETAAHTARDSQKPKVASGSSSSARQPTAGASAVAQGAAVAAHQSNGGRWRLASAVAAGLLAGTVGGWYVRSAHGPSIDAEHIGFYSLPPLVRGPADCVSLQLRASVSLLALRIPGAVPDQQLVPVDSEGHDLTPGSYSVRMQGDGSWLVQLPAATVREQGIRFEARSPDGTVEPRGCVISAAQQ